MLFKEKLCLYWLFVLLNKQQSFLLFKHVISYYFCHIDWKLMQAQIHHEQGEHLDYCLKTEYSGYNIRHAKYLLHMK